MVYRLEADTLTYYWGNWHLRIDAQFYCEANIMTGWVDPEI